MRFSIQNTNISLGAHFQLTDVFAQYARSLRGHGGNGAGQRYFAVLRPLQGQAQQQLETCGTRGCFCKGQGFFIFTDRAVIGDQGVDGAIGQSFTQRITLRNPEQFPISVGARYYPADGTALPTKHTYLTAGTYTLSVTAVDRVGQEGEASRTITVN